MEDNTFSGKTLTISEPASKNLFTIYGKDLDVIFSMSIVDGKLTGELLKPDHMDIACKNFFENLRIYGQTLLDRINVIKELEKAYPNDLEFGTKVREYLNDNSIDRT